MLAIKNTDSDLKVHALHYANELIRYLYASDFSFKILATIEKYVWEKSNVVYLLSIRVQTTINHISILTFLCCFLSQYERLRIFSFRARAEKHTARLIDASSVVGT